VLPHQEVVIGVAGVSDIDTTAAQQFGELFDDLEGADVEVVCARVRTRVHEMMARSGLLEKIGEDSIYLEVDDAVADVQREDPH